MLNDFCLDCPIYIACGYTDLRRGIDGLAGIIQEQFRLDPFQNTLYLFCGRHSDRFGALSADDKLNTIYSLLLEMRP